MLKASSEVLGICKRLEAANALLDDHLYDVLCGLSICTNARFRDTFRFLKQSEDVSGRIQLPGIPHDATVMETIEAVLLKAEDLYDKLCTAGMWNKTKGGGAALNALVFLAHAFWNCGADDHRVGDCPKDHNDDTIAKNRQAFHDTKRSGRGNGSSDSGGRGRGNSGHDSGGRGRGNSGCGHVVMTAVVVVVTILPVLIINAGFGRLLELLLLKGLPCLAASLAV